MQHILLLTVLAGVWHGSKATSLTYPTVISSGLSIPSTWSLDLAVDVGRHSNDQVSFTSRQYCYNGVCTYPGPTILLIPGDNVTVTLTNDLEAASDAGTMNTMHAPNSTNLHTHGLHIDPAVDTIFTTAEPAGGSLTYEYRIPADHAPGALTANKNLVVANELRKYCQYLF